MERCTRQAAERSGRSARVVPGRTGCRNLKTLHPVFSLTADQCCLTICQTLLKLSPVTSPAFLSCTQR